MTYQSQERSTNFQLKNETKFCYENNLPYYDKQIDETCSDDYIEETDRRIEEKVIEARKCNKNSHHYSKDVKFKYDIKYQNMKKKKKKKKTFENH